MFFYIVARMAELVDALVSNTSELTLVPVRSRLRVLSIFSIIFPVWLPLD